MEEQKKHPGGRPRIEYDPIVAEEICFRIANGESLNAIIKSIPQISCRDIVYNWLDENVEFYDNYTKARDRQTETFVDQISDIADDSTNDFYEKALKNGDVVVVGDSEMVNRSRLRVDSRKWIAERMKPKKYGVKQDLNVSGGLNINVVDFSNASGEEENADTD